jgi:predicted small lipoprotein YifL
MGHRSRRAWAGRSPLTAAMIAVAMAGCTMVGPDFTPPAAPSTARYTLSDETKMGEGATGPKVSSGSWMRKGLPSIDSLTSKRPVS